MLVVFICLALLVAFGEWGLQKLFEKRPDLLERVSRVKTLFRQEHCP